MSKAHMVSELVYHLNYIFQVVITVWWRYGGISILHVMLSWTFHLQSLPDCGVVMIHKPPF